MEMNKKRGSQRKITKRLGLSDVEDGFQFEKVLRLEISSFRQVQTLKRVKHLANSSIESRKADSFSSGCSRPPLLFQIVSRRHFSN